MNDDELKKRFGELKRQDAKNAPPFERLVAKRPRAPIPLFVKVVPVFAAAAAFLLWCGSATMRSKESASAPVSAAAPTIRVEAAAQLPLDFLLDSAPITVNLDADPLRGMK